MKQAVLTSKVSIMDFRKPYCSILKVLPSKRYGGIAQLGEHLLCKQGVCGSIPHISTRRKSRGAEPGNNDRRGLSCEVDKVNGTD